MENFYFPNCIEVGCDEAGRGCLAGDVVAAAVILPRMIEGELLQLNDSKQLSEKKREFLRPIIQEKSISWGIGRCSASEIDQINILNASILAMHRAIDSCIALLYKKVEQQIVSYKDFEGLASEDFTPPFINHIIVDGNKFKPYYYSRNNKSTSDFLIPHHTVVKGDSKYASIAAASILAKTERDHIMMQLDSLYPQYGWKKNKAYPTKDHRKAIEFHGITPYHRKSFTLLEEPTLDF